jgi:ubiquinone/menaquinone biosynthesis C-methylase UbiE
MGSHQDYYVTNAKYSKNLDTQKSIYFRKYTNKTEALLKRNDSFLDVGCGTGIALERIKKLKARGVDISKTSITLCMKKGLTCNTYDGKTLPYNDGSFHAVGCFDVLEHVDSPELFLGEMYRVVKTAGYLIIVCPNFLSITNSYHHRTKGFVRKLKNIALVLQKLTTDIYYFDKMATIERSDFHADDDACNVTNPIDIIRWAKSRELTLQYWSGRSVDTGDPALDKLLDRRPVRLFLGSSFLIFKKT